MAILPFADSETTLTPTIARFFGHYVLKLSPIDVIFLLYVHDTFTCHLSKFQRYIQSG